MGLGHHAALLVAYSVALVAAVGFARVLPRLWPAPQAAPFPQPWREVAWAIIASAAVVVIGMLYSRGWLLPATSQHRPALDAVNQLLIYSPFLLLLAFRRQGTDSAWLPRRNVLRRVAIGVALALLALTLYAAARPGINQWPTLLSHVYQPAHVSYCIQVLLEDIGIAIVFVRFQQALGLGGSLVLVATLFSTAHIPGLLARGATAGDLATLLADVGLGVLALSVLHRLRDVWWFWMVHFALDMTQFYGSHAAA